MLTRARSFVYDQYITGRLTHRDQMRKAWRKKHYRFFSLPYKSGQHLKFLGKEVSYEKTISTRSKISSKPCPSFGKEHPLLVIPSHLHFPTSCLRSHARRHTIFKHCCSACIPCIDTLSSTGQFNTHI